MTVPMSKFKDIRYTLDKRTLTITATVSESLTGNQVSRSVTVTMYDESVKFRLLVDNSGFKPGLLWIAHVSTLHYTAYISTQK